jgi:tetratricopeptide (TPR) repeat protein
MGDPGADYEDPEFVLSQVKLADAYEAAGDLHQAVALLERTLAGCQQAPDADQVATAVVRSNLATAYRAAGEVQRAIPLLEQAVADAERTVGDEHPLTLLFRNNLAGVYQDTGEVRLAIRMHEQTLAAQEQVWAPRTPTSWRRGTTSRGPTARPVSRTGPSP